MRISSLILLILIATIGLSTQAEAVHSSPVVNPPAIEKPTKSQKKSKRKRKKVKKGKKLGLFKLLKLRRQMKKAARKAKKSGKDQKLANASIFSGLAGWGVIFSSFILSTPIAGWLLLVLSSILLIAALVLGIKALKKIEKDPERHGGMGKAIFGIVISGIYILWMLLILSYALFVGFD